MHKFELNGRKMKISPAMDTTKRFHRKRMGFFELKIRNKHRVPLDNIILIHNKKIVVVEGQTVVKTHEDGRLIYNQYRNTEEEVQKLMEEWLSKKSLPRLSSRSQGIERRNAAKTTSSHKEITEDKAKEKDVCGSSKGGGRRSLRYVGGDLPACLNLKEIGSKQQH